MSVDLLPSDVWQYIALKLGAADRIRFGAVSKTWKSLLPFRHPPWLLLSDSQEKEGFYEDHPEPLLLLSGDEESDEEEQPNEDEPPPPLVKEEEDHEHEAELPRPRPRPPRRGFVCLGEDKIYDFNLPQLYETNCVGSTGSWLITLHRDDTIRLLNPFSKQQLFLPGICSFEHKVKTRFFRTTSLWKIVLSSSSPSTPSARGRGQDFIAMATHSSKWALAMARLGDSKWTTLQMPALGCDVVLDFIFYKGQFYAVTLSARLLVCDLGDDDGPKATEICRREVGAPIQFRMNYLVECLGELLLVIKWINQFNGITDYSTRSFQVYKFDFVDGEWNEVQSLGEHSLFLGFNTSVSMRASEYCGLVRKNCIYFTDDFLAGYNNGPSKPGHDMGVFDLEDKSIRPHYGGVSTSLYSPPVWIVPSPN